MSQLQIVLSSVKLSGSLWADSALLGMTQGSIGDRYCKFRHWPRGVALKWVDKARPSKNRDVYAWLYIPVAFPVQSHSWVSLRHVFLLQCSKTSNCKSCCVSLLCGCTRGLLCWWGYTMPVLCTRQSRSYEASPLYCCNSWITTLTIL